MIPKGVKGAAFILYIKNKRVPFSIGQRGWQTEHFYEAMLHHPEKLKANQQLQEWNL
jgi:hypothetical protein